MLVLYLIAVALATATVMISVILYIKKRDLYSKFFIALITSMVCFLIADAVFLRLPEKKILQFPDGIGNPTWIPDLFYVCFMFSWILLMRAMNGGKIIVAPKYMLAIFIIYYLFVEVMVQLYAINIIEVWNACFDLFLVVNGMYYVIHGFRFGMKTQEKYVTVTLGICMTLYSIWLVFTDYAVVSKIGKNSLEEWPQDPIVLLCIAVEITVIGYFFYEDPLNIRLEKKLENSDVNLRGVYGLTEREGEIVILLSKGLSNPQIAKEAYITENTVKRHLTSIYRKTDTSNRYELIAKMTRYSK